MDKPILLSDCGNTLVIDDSEKERYQINIQAGEYLLIAMGFNANKPAAKFTHPNISATVKTIHEFKHYRKNGSKFWTSKAGVDHYLVIPRNKILILPEKGYSYIKAEINGVKVSFNVSGGTMNGWTDYLYSKTHTSVNHKLSDIKKIAEVAVYQELTDIPKLAECDEKEWDRLVAKSKPDVKEAIAKLIEAEKNPSIKLISGLTIKEGYGIGVRRRFKRTKLDDTHFTFDESGALKSIIGMFDGCRYFVKMNQIDWAETAKANDIA